MLTVAGEHVKEATAKLKKDFYPHPESLSLLLQILVSDGPPQLRQLVATQARTLVRRHWSKIPDSQKPQIRNALLQSTLHEQNTAVRHGSARVIAVVASLDFADGEWADLPKSMLQAATQPDAKERAVSTYIILTLLDEMTQEQAAQMGPLYDVFQKTIRDPESTDVRVNTLLALVKLAHCINCDEDNDSLEKFHHAFPNMMTVLKDAMAKNNDEHANQCFDGLQELLDDDSKVLGKYFKDLVIFMTMLSGEESHTNEARTQALNFLMNALIKRRAKFQTLKVGSNILQTLWGILGNAEKSGDPTDDGSLAYSAVTLLNVMSVSIPPSQVVGPVIQLFVRSSESTSAREREVATTMLRACVEGAPEFVDQQISTILPKVLKLMHDPDTAVRRAALDACNELAECIPESVAKDHQAVMQALAQNLATAAGELQGAGGQLSTEMVIACCQGIDGLSRGIPAKDLENYLQGLVPHLCELFNFPNNRIKETSIGAVGSIAAQSKKAFMPYFADTMNALQGNLALKGSEELLQVRGVTLDTMGALAMAVGAEKFQPYVKPLMQNSEEGLHFDSPLLKESSYLFWASLASVYQKEFEPFLPGVTTTLLEALEEFDPTMEAEAGDAEGDLVGKEIMIGGRNVKIVGSGATNGEDEEDDLVDVEEVEIDEDDDWDDIANLTALEGDQEAVLDSLAQIFSRVGPAYLQYFPRTIESTAKLIEHPVDNIRKVALTTLGAAFEALWELQPEDQQKWEPGLPLQKEPMAELSKLREVIITAALTQYKHETDR